MKKQENPLWDAMMEALFRAGFTQQQIAEVFKVNQPAVSVAIARHRAAQRQAVA